MMASLIPTRLASKRRLPTLRLASVKVGLGDDEGPATMRLDADVGAGLIVEDSEGHT
jgi:hypothetical protein